MSEKDHTMPHNTVAILDLSNLSELQVQSLRRLSERARGAHYADIVLRINGRDETTGFEADWLKHLIFTTRDQSHQAEIERLEAKILVLRSNYRSGPQELSGGAGMAAAATEKQAP